jgi:hypothetical protein
MFSWDVRARDPVGERPERRREQGAEGADVAPEAEGEAGGEGVAAARRDAAAEAEAAVEQRVDVANEDALALAEAREQERIADVRVHPQVVEDVVADEVDARRVPEDAGGQGEALVVEAQVVLAGLDGRVALPDAGPHGAVPGEAEADVALEDGAEGEHPEELPLEAEARQGERAQPVGEDRGGVRLRDVEDGAADELDDGLDEGLPVRAREEGEDGDRAHVRRRDGALHLRRRVDLRLLLGRGEVDVLRGRDLRHLRRRGGAVRGGDGRRGVLGRFLSEGRRRRQRGERGEDAHPSIDHWISLPGHEGLTARRSPRAVRRLAQSASFCRTSAMPASERADPKWLAKKPGAPLKK